MAVAVAEAAAVPMSAARVLAIAAMVFAASLPSVAQPTLAVHVVLGDTVSPRVVYQAKDAQAARRWHDAAQLWQVALLANGSAAEHWQSYGHALFNSGRYREAIGAYQRGLQLGGTNVDDALWNVARSYAQLGNRKQTLRWLEQSLARGGRTRSDISAEPMFRRFARDAGFRALLAKTSVVILTMEV